MRVVIAGGHGHIARLLERRLAEEGHTGVGIVRRREQFEDITAAGGEPALLDLEQASVEDVARLLDGADAAVFAAGAGGGSTPERTDAVDRAGAALFAAAAERAGVRPFVQVSSIGVDEPPAPGAGEGWAAYVAAKKAAEDDLRDRDLDWRILRPASLTDDDGTGGVDLVAERGAVTSGEVPRADVAAVIVALLERPDLHHVTLELTKGSTPVAEAVKTL
ncbi:NAD(P)H-binding protein [Actinomadura parmotrematis]|uniref:NAD(P)H-binding protein n=1 Tax=Actinomadura parmotrematis TaxID=2864039 RepID=A0ABS7FN52_9ACTN|nr:NAD(P)H-binding protein [Actinomadura parmotrematis]MBW8481818.1 NAD(P)H-binding protein [Actinomadura parmotrematis]